MTLTLDARPRTSRHGPGEGLRGPNGRTWLTTDTSLPSSGPFGELGKARPRRSPRILLVDDDVVLREALRDMLQDEGLHVIAEAADGEAAVEMARRLMPDVVLMDNRMPVMGGIEATRLIREQLPPVRVIVLTAYDDPGLSRTAEEAGAFGYLVKGCPPAEIMDKVREAAGRSGPPQNADPAGLPEPG